MQGLETIITY